MAGGHNVQVSLGKEISISRDSNKNNLKHNSVKKYSITNINPAFKILLSSCEHCIIRPKHLYIKHNLILITDVRCYIA